MTDFYTLFKTPPNDALVVPEEDYCVEATEATHRDSDINHLIQRYNLGDLSALSGVDKPPVFGDFRKAVSYEDSKQAVIDAERQFMTLPAELRAKFNNDPGQLLKWLDDPKNFDEAIQLGLLVAPNGYLTPEQRKIKAENEIKTEQKME